MRRPYRERFAIILNEFGAGLAGRGKDLRTVIREANPALREFDKRARDPRPAEQAAGARAPRPATACWPSGPAQRKAASRTRSCSRNIAAQATAERRADLERNFEMFPEFLQRADARRWQRFARLSREMAPVVSDLRAVGPRHQPHC